MKIRVTGVEVTDLMRILQAVPDKPGADVLQVSVQVNGLIFAFGKGKARFVDDGVEFRVIPATVKKPRALTSVRGIAPESPETK